MAIAIEVEACGAIAFFRGQKIGQFF